METQPRAFELPPRLTREQRKAAKAREKAFHAALKGRADAVPMRREVAEMMSEVEIATAQRDARAWMTAH